ncbi:MAG: RagB/SusD family nutrient uptake outer membrane protein [Tannerellaceae bacterium]|nr:RagB/SusD family nutrient uptake outer membrane protein [Tannerellaceae bacterium]
MKTIYKGMLAAGLALLITGCSFTDLEPTDKVSNSDIFSSTSAMEQAVNGAYAKMSLREIIKVSALLSDDVIKGGQNGGAGDDTYQWTYTASTGDHNDLWAKLYSVNSMANRILDGAGEVPVNGADEQKSWNNSIGTVMFMRAYLSFDLLRFFADFEDGSKYGIPYILKPVILDTPGRNTVAECFDLIHKDLEEAMNLVSQDKPSDPGYVSKTAIKALQARVYLYQRQYDKAYECASAAIQDKPLATINNYPSIWEEESNDDIILKLKKLAGEERIDTIFFSADNSSAFEPAQELIDIYDAGDIRLNLFIGDGVDREGVAVKRVNKYKGIESVGLADQKLLRSSEMILIMAEAKAQTDLAEANKLLNQLRAERIEGWENQTYATKDQFIEELLLERRRELCFEGHRFFDLRRYNLPIVKPLINKTLEVDNYRRLQPIPYGEMQGNPVIAGQQNPGY